MSKTPLNEDTIPSELSRSLNVQALRENRRFTGQIVATPDECKALARRYAILGVNHLKADIVLKVTGQDLIRLTAKIDAQIVQACGVSLEPVTQDIVEAHEELLTTSADMLSPLEEMMPGLDSPTELIEGDTINYGEIVAQVVALAIDPFPRKQEAAPVDHIEHGNNPFAVLQKLQKGGTPLGETPPANDQD